MTCAQLLKCQTPSTLILRTPLSRMVRFCWGMLGLVSNPTHIGHFGKYHYTLCLSPTNFALFLFSLGTIVIPKRNWKQCLCKIWGAGANKEYYSIFWSGLFVEFWNQNSFYCNFNVWTVIKLCYFVSCSGEPDATSIQWKVLKLNELTPCACGSYYLLKRGNPTKLDLGDPEADHHH